MCKVSDKLQLCTCKGNIESLRHYWILHRFIEGRNIVVMGECMPPAQIDPQIDAMNENLLLLLLNEKNVFDTNINPLEKDRLEISFLVSPENYERLTYGFEYRNGKWRIELYDVFEWMSHHHDEISGKIKNPFVRKRKNV